MLEELDLAIPNMDTPEAECAARTVLENLPGVLATRLIERGAWIEYDPATSRWSAFVRLSQGPPSA